MRADPARSAVLLDVDGTLAPIVADAADASVPASTRGELARLAERYRLVACVSGRAGPDARRVVGVGGLEYVGNHGLELDARARDAAGALASFRDGVDWPVEDKGLTLSYHFRTADDEKAARCQLEEVAAAAHAVGLEPRWGRKVLEIRPAVPADKGTALVALLDRSGATSGLYAGDDATDLDAFIGLGEAGLEHAVRIAVASDEAPDELRDAADLVVESPEGLADLLRLL